MAEKEYIEREAAINAMCRLCSDTTREKCRIADICNHVCRLEAVPAADVRPVVRGKWIPDYDYTDYDYDGSTPLAEPLKFQDGWQCSLCGGYTPSETNFCPNCGADMREPPKEET